MKILPTFIIAALVLCLRCACAVDLQLGWNVSPTPGITNYVLYVGTNDLSATNALARLDCGTNLQVSLKDIQPANYQFAVTAVSSNGIESDFSNVIYPQVPAPPQHTHTIIGEQSVTLTNWSEFFRLKISTP